MRGLPEEVVFAAAKAVFEHCVVNCGDREAKARHWLDQASHYREIARVALAAGLPLLDEGPPGRLS